MAVRDSQTKTLSTDLEAQRAYVEKVRQAGFDFGLVVADAFVRGIRDIGYRHTGTAIDELIDNGIQAEASRIDVVFGYDGSSSAKPARIAVIDDGHGMDPEMIRLAVVWGGTHREAPAPDKRQGFGRYGYGLPSACVSQGRRFTVYSVVEGGGWHAITVDVDDISDGKYNDPNTGRIVVPEPKASELPGWVERYLDSADVRLGENGSRHGTIVVIEKVDRLSWSTTTGLERNLLQHFAVTYRNFLRRIDIYVNTKKVEPVDPLFITPGFRFYDLDEDRAEPLEPMVIAVKDRDRGTELGHLRVRWSYLPTTFGRLEKDRDRGGTNARFEIMKEHNGFIFLREGRQIDVVTRNPWLTIQNNDRYWKIEIDFPATLDEEFSITTSKQRVIPSDRIWELLREAGVPRAIQHLRKRYDREAKELKQTQESKGEKRASVQVMEETTKFKAPMPGTDPVKRQKRAQQRLEEEARRQASETGRPFEEVERELETELKGRPYDLRYETMAGAPFFRVDQIGGQTVLFVNTAHRFYTDVYMGPDATPRLRAALELLMFILGECELDATNDRRTFYEQERMVWSMRLGPSLDRLNQIHNIEDATMADALVEDEAVEHAV